MTVTVPLQPLITVVVVTMLVVSEPPGSVDVVVLPTEVEVVVVTATEVGY
jgi:hypothetical protein